MQYCYRKFNINYWISLLSINEDDNRTIQNVIKEVSKGECIIMGDVNHRHIQWKSLENTAGEDQQFLLFIQDNFLTQHKVVNKMYETRLGH